MAFPAALAPKYAASDLYLSAPSLVLNSALLKLFILFSELVIESGPPLLY